MDSPVSLLMVVVRPWRLQVHWGGEVQEGPRLTATLNPVFRFKVAFKETVACPALAPLLCLTIMDQDFASSERAGSVAIDPRDLPVFEDDAGAEDLPLPPYKSYAVFREVRGKFVSSPADLLLSAAFYAVDASKPRPPLCEPQAATRPATIEIIALGCRDLRPYQLLPIECPYVDFEVSTLVAQERRSTNTSRSPSAQHPNFNERLLIPVDLPLDASAAPRLTITVKDIRFGGLHKPIIGVASVDLTQRIPWAPGYVPVSQAGSQKIKQAVQQHKAGLPSEEASVYTTSRRRRRKPLTRAGCWLCGCSPRLHSCPPAFRRPAVAGARRRSRRAVARDPHPARPPMRAQA